MFANEEAFHAKGLKMEDDKPPMGKLVKRPTGAGWLFTGYVFIFFSLFAVLLAFFDYGPADSAKRVWTIYFAAACLSISMGFLSVGSVIRAIWFLPGEAEKRTPTD